MYESWVEVIGCIAGIFAITCIVGVVVSVDGELKRTGRLWASLFALSVLRWESVTTSIAKHLS